MISLVSSLFSTLPFHIRAWRKDTLCMRTEQGERITVFFLFLFFLHLSCVHFFPFFLLRCCFWLSLSLSKCSKQKRNKRVGGKGVAATINKRRRGNNRQLSGEENEETNFLFSPSTIPFSFSRKSQGRKRRRRQKPAVRSLSVLASQGLCRN